ncbi:conserved hypothetical protein [uncultured Mycobacterium sp.]|uniref:DUF2505 domain-containing protein n=1 Tax=uncultured Mycobacterium sp. TaxID=171292 RepID=A0A1Y5PEE1_9MYCO|nr:conserved hypothetical protein [uncultured Mycobacterium sp.]SBS75689.1 conserved hypothetical protein [uncultured Mycobacterium sp.]
MARSFDILAESVANVDQIHAAFGREDYWLDRLAGDVSASLDSLVVETDGTVAVQLTQYLGRQLLPGAVAKLIPGDLKLLYREAWRPPADDGHVHGKATVAVGELGSSEATNLLAPTANGSQLRAALTVQVKIPFVGGALEKTIGAGLTQSIPSVLRFTTTWIAEHA